MKVSKMQGVMRFVSVPIALLAALAALATPAHGQALLPPSLGEWSSAAFVQASPEKLEGLAGPAAPFLREYGIVSAEYRTYARAGYSVDVTAYLMLDTTAAYGVFTFLRDESMKPAGFADFCAISPGRGVLLTGRAVYEVNAKGANALTEILKILAARGNAGPQDVPYPTLPNYLPMQGLQEGSERFTLGPLALEKFFPTGKGDWPAFELGAEAIVAHYRLNGREATLVLISYPNHLVARQRGEMLRGMFNVNGGDVAGSKRLPVFVRRSRSLLAIAAQIESAEMAQRLLQKIDYQETLTLNEPGFRATERSLIAAIYTIMVLIGVLMCFALVAGMAYGGLRLAVKRVLPGKIFDRESEIEILQLGLSSKPIEAKDFYLPARSGKSS